MWYDDFDMELYKVIPEAKEVLAPVADLRLMTTGRPDSNGKLNHPTVWNGANTMLAFFDVPPTGVDALAVGLSLKAAPAEYWTDDPTVICSMGEAVRDCWVHHYSILVPDSRARSGWLSLWDGLRLHREFEFLMYHLRGWRKQPEGDVADARECVLKSLKTAVKATIGWQCARQ